jgi:hypothetical protein
MIFDRVKPPERPTIQHTNKLPTSSKHLWAVERELDHRARAESKQCCTLPKWSELTRPIGRESHEAAHLIRFAETGVGTHVVKVLFYISIMKRNA